MSSLEEIPKDRIIGSQSAMQEDVDESFFDFMEKCSRGPVTDEELAACPLFAEKVEDLPEGHINTQAFKSIIYDEITPREKAEDFKDKGNKALTRGVKYYEDAIEFYSHAIDQKSGVAAENSVYYSNRAQVNLLMKNYGWTIADCVQSLKLNPANIKSYFRGAKASFELKKYKQAAQFCQSGLSFDPENVALKTLLDSTKAKIHEEDKKEAARIEAEERKRQQKEAFNRSLAARGVKIGQPIFGDTEKYEKEATVYLDSNGKLHWPIIFLYPEHSQSDFVHDISEDDTIYSHLFNMFASKREGGPGSPPWDKERKYHPDRLAVYYKSYMCLPKDSELRAEYEEKHNYQQKWIKVDVNSTFKKLVSRKDYIVPNAIPIIHVVVEKSTFEKSMLEKD